MPDSEVMHAHLRSVNASYPRSDEIRVVLADDHAGLRRSLRRLLDREDGIEVAGEASDIEEAARQVSAHRPDVVVLGVPDGSMAERIERFRGQAPQVQVVVITMHKNRLLAERALSAGASAFVLKDSAETELGDAVRSAARGIRYISPRLRPAA
jgi:DNA-binding NarL/FixJ family response regulator